MSTKFDALMVELNNTDNALTAIVNRFEAQIKDLERLRGSLRRVRAYLQAGAAALGDDNGEDPANDPLRRRLWGSSRIPSLEENLRNSISDKKGKGRKR